VERGVDIMLKNGKVPRENAIVSELLKKRKKSNGTAKTAGRYYMETQRNIPTKHFL